MKKAACAWIACFLLVGFSGVCRADTKRVFTYRYEKVWRTAVRFVRIDSRMPIVEKDEKNGYLLFEYQEEGRTYQAALELVPTAKDGKKYVRIGLRIEAMPGYVEAVFLEHLRLKLKDEYGDPPPAELVAAPGNSGKSAEGDADDGEENEEQTSDTDSEAKAKAPDSEPSEKE